MWTVGSMWVVMSTTTDGRPARDMSHRAGTIVEVVDMTRSTRTTTAEDPRDALVAWLWTDEASRAARAELHRFGLDLYDAADLLNDVAVRLLTADITTTIDNPAGYVRRSMRLRAIDLLRGEQVRTHESLPDTFDEADDDAGADVAEVAIASQVEDAVRRSLFVALTRAKAWMVAAALNTLTLRMHPEVAVPPEAPDHAETWSALWLAGERGCFGDDAAARQARSRKLRAVEGLLIEVAEAVVGHGAGRDDDDA